METTAASKFENGMASHSEPRAEKLRDADAMGSQREEDVKEDTESETTLKYGLADFPPLFVTVSIALQHILLCLSGALANSSIVADVACVPSDHNVRAELLCSTLFMIGLCTILQTAFGVRLPIFQGPSSSFIVPLLSMTQDSRWRCGDTEEIDNTLTHNTTNATVSDEVMSGIRWRLQEISGALMVASLVEVVVGATGLLILLLRFIGPITVAVVISHIGLTIQKLAVPYGRANYAICFGTAGLSLLFSLYLGNVAIPLPKIGKDRKEMKRPKFRVFGNLPILLAVIIMWALTWILTACDVFTDDQSDVKYKARGDAKINIIGNLDWFQITYPGQFGTPKINLALTVGFIASVLSSTVESVGDYHIAYKLCGLQRLPQNAVGRGILVEGIGSVLSGSVGAGHATTSYTTNIALIRLSRNASRYVMYAAGIILIVFSLLGKLGAALTTVPDPIIGGILIFTSGILVGIGLSNLNQVDMTSTRNLVVVGVSIVTGLIVPKIVEDHPEVLRTDIPEVNRVITITLGTSMFVAGVLAFVLDATVPGGAKNHDEKEHHADDPEVEDTLTSEAYSWSIYPRLVRLFPLVTSLPFMPGVPKTVEAETAGDTFEQIRESTSF